MRGNGIPRATISGHHQSLRAAPSTHQHDLASTESQAGQPKPGVRVATIPSAWRCCVAFDGNSRQQRGGLVVERVSLPSLPCVSSPLPAVVSARVPSRIGPPRSSSTSPPLLVPSAEGGLLLFLKGPAAAKDTTMTNPGSRLAMCPARRPDTATARRQRSEVEAPQRSFPEWSRHAGSPSPGPNPSCPPPNYPQCWLLPGVPDVPGTPSPTRRVTSTERHWANVPRSPLTSPRRLSSPGRRRSSAEAGGPTGDTLEHLSTWLGGHLHHRSASAVAL